jgi:hypothetical protein
MHADRSSESGRTIFWILAAASLVGVAGCSGAPGPEDPSPTTASVTSDLTTSSEDECSFPTQGGGWQDDELEDKLRPLGCSTPEPYYITADGRLFVWTRCPNTREVFDLVRDYDGTPWDAKIFANRCVREEPHHVNVKFDPTCGTCHGNGGGPNQ